MLRGSFFKEILKRTLFTLIVPFLTIILIYTQADSVIKEQILLRHENVLNQFYEQLDAKMEEAAKTIYEIVFLEEVRNYGPDDGMSLAYQRLTIRQRLWGYAGEDIADLFVYYAEDERIVSGVYSILERESYMKNNWPQVQEGEFLRLVSESTIRPTLCLMENTNGEPYLCMTVRSGTIGTRSKEYVVVMIFEESFIPQLVQPQSAEGGTLLLFDGDMKLIKSENDERGYHLNDYSGEEVPFKTEAGGNGYMMQVRNSQAIDAYYAYATPEEYFWEALGEIRTLCLLIGMACVGISLAMTYRNSKYSYQPVMDMLTRVKEYGGQDYEPMKHSEFEFLEDVLKQNISEKHNLSRQLNKSANIHTERFLMSLIGGHVEHRGKNDSVFADNGIELCSNRFMVVLLSIEESLEVEVDLAVFITNNVLSEMLQEKCISYFARINANRCLMFVNVKGNVEVADFVLAFTEGGGYLLSRCKITVTIMLGGIHEGIEGIQHSYSEALQAEKYKFLFGLGQCVNYGDICHREYEGNQAVESKLLKVVAGFVKDRSSKKSAECFVNEILDMYEISKQSSIEYVESFRYELFGVLHRVSATISNRAEQSGEMLRELMRQPTLERFCEKTANYLSFLQEREQENEVVEEVCIRCKEYIDAEYKNPQLSVAEVGNEMKMTPSYLSKLFRIQYGVAIPEYIALTRIQSCKLELKETNKSITEIAEGNGFLNSNIFIKTFKKYEGITPGMYRKLQ